MKDFGFLGKITLRSTPDHWENLLIALYNKNQFLICLALVEEYEQEKQFLSIIAPPFPKEKVVTLLGGSIRMNKEGIQLGYI